MMLFVIGGLTGIILATRASTIKCIILVSRGAFSQYADSRPAFRHAGGVSFLVSESFRLSARRALGHDLGDMLDRSASFLLSSRFMRSGFSAFRVERYLTSIRLICLS